MCYTVVSKGYKFDLTFKCKSISYEYLHNLKIIIEKHRIKLQNELHKYLHDNYYFTKCHVNLYHEINTYDNSITVYIHAIYKVPEYIDATDYISSKFYSIVVDLMYIDKE